MGPLPASHPHKRANIFWMGTNPIFPTLLSVKCGQQGCWFSKEPHMMSGNMGTLYCHYTAAFMNWDFMNGVGNCLANTTALPGWSKFICLTGRNGLLEMHSWSSEVRDAVYFALVFRNSHQRDTGHLWRNCLKKPRPICGNISSNQLCTG